MSELNYFLGIDLGTTNSVIAYANPQAETGLLKPIVIDVPRLSDTGGTTHDKTLPSVVYYQQDKGGAYVPVVGDFAKNQYGKRFGFVIKSVKSSMGEGAVPDMNADLPDSLPEDVSAQILRQLVAGAKKKLILSSLPDDVVITVPASFDGDQCKATLDAAQKAGIQAYDQKGHTKDMLLSEPKAVLYDIVNSQMNGEIPASIMDVSTPKNILVYDLGGGTLDVSLYRVSQNEQKGELLDIRDIAISRYTRLGGDDFDTLIASHLCDEFLDFCQGQFTVTAQARKEIMSICTKKAEMLKIDMNNAYDTVAVRGETLPDDYTVYMNEMNLYNGYPYERDLSKQEMLDFIRPLLGEHLTLDAVDRFPQLKAEQDVNTIIYPVLDVLYKAKEHNHGAAVPIDYVILNGGMSKFFPVVDRVREFFGKEPITLNDPDMSVAKGAAIYHYYLHKYHVESHLVSLTPAVATPSREAVAKQALQGSLPKRTPGTLLDIPAERQNFLNVRTLNDTLNLEVRGGHMFPLAKAGTALPFSSDALDILTLPKDGDSIRLPLYYGNGPRAEFPNRKVAERILSFRKTYAGDTPISLQIHIDSLGIVSLRTWVTGAEELGTVSMAVGNGTDQPVLRRPKTKVKPVLANSRVGVVLDYRSECNTLYDLCLRQQLAGRGKNKQIAAKATQQCKEVLRRMRNAQNGNDAGRDINDALERFSGNTYYLGRLLGVGGYLYPLWPRSEQGRLHKRCRQLVESALQNIRFLSIRDYHMQAINALTQMDEPDDIPLLERCLRCADKSLAPCAAVALAKRQADPTLLIGEFLDLTVYDIQKLDSYAWAIGRLCAREDGTYHNQDMLQAGAMKCVTLLRQKTIRNASILNSIAYALGEICDHRVVAMNVVPESYRQKGLKALRDALDGLVGTKMEPLCRTKFYIALKMIEGDVLTADEGAQLLALRQRNE